MKCCWFFSYFNGTAVAFKKILDFMFCFWINTAKVTRDNLTYRNGIMATLKGKCISSDKIKRMF